MGSDWILYALSPTGDSRVEIWTSDTKEEMSFAALELMHGGWFVLALLAPSGRGAANSLLLQPPVEIDSEVFPPPARVSHMGRSHAAASPARQDCSPHADVGGGVLLTEPISLHVHPPCVGGATAAGLSPATSRAACGRVTPSAPLLRVQGDPFSRRHPGRRIWLAPTIATSRGRLPARQPACVASDSAAVPVPGRPRSGTEHPPTACRDIQCILVAVNFFCFGGAFLLTGNRNMVTF